jgi:hypothetical protein
VLCSRCRGGGGSGRSCFADAPRSLGSSAPIRGIASVKHGEVVHGTVHDDRAKDCLVVLYVATDNLITAAYKHRSSRVEHRTCNPAVPTGVVNHDRGDRADDVNALTLQAGYDARSIGGDVRVAA